MPAGVDLSFSTEEKIAGRVAVNYLNPAILPYSKVKAIRVGDKGEDVYAITKEHYPSYPAYWQHGSLIKTRIDGHLYDVAFLLDEHSGVITDISYKKQLAELGSDSNEGEAH